MQTRSCQATTQDGRSCKGTPLPGRDVCFIHDPTRTTDLTEWRRQGGRAKSNAARAAKKLPPEPLSTGQLHGYLGGVFLDVIAGKVEPGVATAAANVARTMAELAKTSEVEQRLADLERRLTGRSA